MAPHDFANNSRVRRKMGKSWLQSYGMRRIIVLWTFVLVRITVNSDRCFVTRSLITHPHRFRFAVCQLRTKFVQHPSLKVISICRGNYWGSSMWVPTKQVDYWSFILHSSKAWEKMGIKWSSASALYRLQESLWFT